MGAGEAISAAKSGQIYPLLRRTVAPVAQSFHRRRRLLGSRNGRLDIIFDKGAEQSFEFDGSLQDFEMVEISLNRPLDPISGRCVQVALALGLFKKLSKKPKGITELVSECGCSERGLRPLLHLLASVALIGERDGGYLQAPNARTYLKNRWRREWEAFPAIPEYEKLEQAVRTGRPVRAPVEGTDDEGAFFSQIVAALCELHAPDARYVAERLPPGLVAVLDLGAGSAVWSLALAGSRPEVRVVAVDREKVLNDVTRGYLHQHGVLEQYELRSGNYHDVDLEAGRYDLVYLGHLLHADGPDASRRLLARSYAALRPGGYVVVAEIVGSEPRSNDYASNVFDLNMLMLTEHGVVFTGPELERLVTEAGFVACRWLQGPGDYPVLLAERPPW